MTSTTDAVGTLEIGVALRAFKDWLSEPVFLRVRPKGTERDVEVASHPVLGLIARCGGSAELVNEMMERWWPVPEVLSRPLQANGLPFQVYVPMALGPAAADLSATVLVPADPANKLTAYIGEVYPTMQGAVNAAAAANVKAGLPETVADVVLSAYAVGVALEWKLPSIEGVLSSTTQGEVLSAETVAERVKGGIFIFDYELEKRVAAIRGSALSADAQEDLVVKAEADTEASKAALRAAAGKLGARGHVEASDTAVEEVQTVIERYRLDLNLLAGSAGVASLLPPYLRVAQLRLAHLTTLDEIRRGTAYRWLDDPVTRKVIDRWLVTDVISEEHRAIYEWARTVMESTTAEECVRRTTQLITSCASEAGRVYQFAADHPDTMIGEMLSDDPRADATRLLAMRGRKVLSEADEAFLRNRHAQVEVLAGCFEVESLMGEGEG